MDKSNNQSMLNMFSEVLLHCETTESKLSTLGSGRLDVLRSPAHISLGGNR